MAQKMNEPRFGTDLSSVFSVYVSFGVWTHFEVMYVSCAEVALALSGDESKVVERLNRPSTNSPSGETVHARRSSGSRGNE